MKQFPFTKWVDKAKKGLPWYVKLAVKLVLARLPVSYGSWSKINLFRHGQMDDSSYAWDVAMRHLTRCLERHPEKTDFDVLEIGPGDSLTSAAVAHALGARQVLLLDVGDFAKQDVKGWHNMADYLRERGTPVDGLESIGSGDEALLLCGARHLTGGLGDLAGMPDESVDFVWSNAVLEHVPLDEFDLFQQELYRVMRSDGVASHGIDFKDHLGYSLNNLRFSERVWESRLFRLSGFYTNRLRFRETIEIFEKIGFRVEVVLRLTWPELPLARSKLAPSYRSCADEDLLVSAAEVVLVKR